MQRLLSDWHAKIGKLTHEFEDKYEHVDGPSTVEIEEEYSLERVFGGGVYGVSKGNHDPH